MPCPRTDSVAVDYTYTVSNVVSSDGQCYCRLYLYCITCLQTDSFAAVFTYIQSDAVSSDSVAGVYTDKKGTHANTTKCFIFVAAIPS